VEATTRAQLIEDLRSVAGDILTPDAHALRGSTVDSAESSKESGA